MHFPFFAAEFSITVMADIGISPASSYADRQATSLWRSFRTVFEMLADRVRSYDLVLLCYLFEILVANQYCICRAMK